MIMAKAKCNGRQWKKRNIIRPSVERECSVLKYFDIDENDHQILEEMHQECVRAMFELNDGVPPAIDFARVIGIRKNDTERRVHHLTMPELNMPLPRSLLRFDFLESLDLRFCSIPEFPRWFKELRSLKNISVSLYQKQSLSESISELSGLESLTVDGKRYRASESPGYASAHRKHKKLRMSSNGHSDDHTNLINLDTSSVFNEEIRTISESVGNLPKLKQLSIINIYRLHRIPDSIDKLIGLKILNLSFTGIETLPCSIGNLRSLEMLSLYFTTRLSELPDELGKLTMLEYLDLRGSAVTSRENPKFSEWLGNASKNLKNLRVLHLGEAFLGSESSYKIASKVLKESPKLGCLGFETGCTKRNPKYRAMAQILADNRAKSRLVGSPTIDHHERFFRLSLWPLILEKANLVFANYYPEFPRMCECCWSCIEDHSDALFRLLVNHGAKVVECRGGM